MAGTFEGSGGGSGGGAGGVSGSGRGAEVEPSLVTLTHAIYGLHAASLLVGIVGAASIVGSFLFGIPSILAVILNYVKRSDVRGTYLESHFRWQIRTFWLAFGWSLFAGLLAITIVLLPVTLAILFGVALWIIYRVVKGWIELRDGREMPV